MLLFLKKRKIIIVMRARIFNLTRWLRLINVEVAGKGKLLNEELMQEAFERANADRSDVY